MIQRMANQRDLVVVNGCVQRWILPWQLPLWNEETVTLPYSANGSRWCSQSVWLAGKACSGGRGVSGVRGCPVGRSESGTGKVAANKLVPSPAAR